MCISRCICQSRKKMCRPPRSPPSSSLPRRRLRPCWQSSGRFRDGGGRRSPAAPALSKFGPVGGHNGRGIWVESMGTATGRAAVHSVGRLTGVSRVGAAVVRGVEAGVRETTTFLGYAGRLPTGGAMWLARRMAGGIRPCTMGDA